MITQEELAQRFKRLRAARGWSLQDVARKIPEVSNSTLSNFETGKRKIDTDHFLLIATWMGVDLETPIPVETTETFNRIRSTLHNDPTLSVDGVAALMALMQAAYKEVTAS